MSDSDRIPNNLTFYRAPDDKEGNFNGKMIDFVLWRAVEIPWKECIEKAFECLNDGRWVEIQYMALKPQGISRADSAVREWEQKLGEAMSEVGKSTDSSALIYQLLVDTGFINIAVKEYKWPLNHSLEFGNMPKTVFTDALESISTMLLMKKLGLGWPNVSLLTFQARNEINNEADAFLKL